MNKGERTRLSIIEKAIELSYEDGLENLNFNQLAFHCGLSQPAMYKYFNNKSDLLSYCLLHAAKSGRDFIDNFHNERDSAEKRLQGYLEGNLKWSRKFKSHGHILISMYYFAKNNPKINETFRVITTNGLNRISTLIISGEREKLWMIKDHNIAASVVHSLLMGEMIKEFNDRSLAVGEEKFIRMIINHLKSNLL